MKITLYKVLTMVLDAKGGGFPINTTNPDDQYTWGKSKAKAEKVFNNAFLLSPALNGTPIKQIVTCTMDERTYSRCIRQDEGMESINYAIDFDWQLIKEGIMQTENPEASQVIEERYIFN